MISLSSSFIAAFSSSFGSGTGPFPRPTVSQFADFLNISQSNATYKVNNLIKKGYILRQNSTVDRREYHLILSEKYYTYLNLYANYELTVMQRVKERFPEEDIAVFDRILQIMSDELMPECKR